MTSRHITEILVDLLYDELPEGKKKEALAHLEECPRCAQEYEELKKTLGALEELEDPSPPKHLDTRIKARARDKALPRPQWKKILQPAVAVAAGLVIAVSLFVVYKDKETERVAESDDWIREAAEQIEAPEKSSTACKGPCAREVTPPRILDKDTASEEMSLAMAESVERQAMTSGSPAGSTLSPLAAGGSVLPGTSTAGGTSLLAGVTGADEIAGTSVSSQQGTSIDADTPATVAKGMSVMSGDTVMEVAGLEEPEDAEMLLSREDSKKKRDRKDLPSESENFKEEEAGDTNAREKGKDIGWGWRDTPVEPAPAGTGARAADTAHKPRAGVSSGRTVKDAPPETKAESDNGLSTTPSSEYAPEPPREKAERKAGSAKQKGVFKPDPETRRTLKRAELARRALGCRAAISAYEQALEDMGFGTGKTPACAPVVESTIKSALECYYKLGKGDKALKLEKWRNKVCPPP